MTNRCADLPTSFERLGTCEGTRTLWRNTQWAEEARGAEAEARARGWSIPPAAPIPVALAELGDANWHLEPEELGF